MNLYTLALVLALFIPFQALAQGIEEEDDFSASLIIGGQRTDTPQYEESLNDFIERIMRGSELHRDWFRKLAKMKRTRRFLLVMYPRVVNNNGRWTYDAMLEMLRDGYDSRYDFAKRDPFYDATVFCHVAHIDPKDWNREAAQWVKRKGVSINPPEFAEAINFIAYTHPEIEPHECSCPPIP